jgi:hypothetical protein
LIIYAPQPLAEIASAARETTVIMRRITLG